VHGFLEDADLGGVRFDAAYCSEVIEHAPDPDRFAMALAAALAPGGLLYITTPDIDHWRRPRELARWDAWNPPSHCVYFNPKNLKLLLAKHGLTPVWRAISFKPGIKMIVRMAG
jgi:2-polyprenyl-6-hydroxyphenyl methylase/3-demethylubiquinone-9 3-methyltransferase